MKRLLMCILLALLAAALLVPAAALDAAYRAWMAPTPAAARVVGPTRSSTRPGPMAWFEVHQIRPNVYAIYEPGNWQEVMSYLFIGPHKAMLFDTRHEHRRHQAAHRLADPLPVFVVNSHFHPDHTGGNFQYDEVWAMRDRLRALAARRAGHTTDVAFFIIRTSMWPRGRTPPPSIPSTYCIPPYTITHWLQDGDVIDLGDMKFEVIHTPGHSPDGTCLLDRAHRLLLVGDVWYNGQLGVQRPQRVHEDGGEAGRHVLQGRLHPAEPQLHDDPVGVADRGRAMPSAASTTVRATDLRGLPGRRRPLLRLRLLQRLGGAEADTTVRRDLG